MISGDLNIDSNGKTIPLEVYKANFHEEFLPGEEYPHLKTEYDIMMHFFSEGGKHEVNDLLRDKFESKGGDWDHIATISDYKKDSNGIKIP